MNTPPPPRPGQPAPADPYDKPMALDWGTEGVSKPENEVKYAGTANEAGDEEQYEERYEEDYSEEQVEEEVEAVPPPPVDPRRAAIEAQVRRLENWDQRKRDNEAKENKKKKDQAEYNFYYLLPTKP
ncbi:hypothetical protein WCLP8_5290001 [uncultured Gammaproteobacteria bacterium]